MDFWQALDQLAARHALVIDRPAGSAHPRYIDFIYPLDYGYLQGTSSSDGSGIDVWRGSNSDAKINAIITIVDLVKRDSEIKILMGCTESEIKLVNQVHNETEFMKGLLMRRQGGRDD